jgi:tetratricopeptide (TPR) repeat protein
MKKKTLQPTRDKAEEKKKESPSSPPGPGSFSRLGWAVVLIAVLGLFIYLGTLSYPFQFDDMVNITENQLIREWKPWWEYAFENRPIGYFSFALNYHFFEYDVAWWRTINIAIHIGTALLVRWAILLLYTSPVLENDASAKHKQGIALFAALLFVVHPLATQSVTYIVQRMASQAALFYLLSLALYLKARLGTGGAARIMFLLGAVAAGYLAVNTKENAYTLPLAIALIEICFLHKNWPFRIPEKYFPLLLAIPVVLVAVALPFAEKIVPGVFKSYPPSPLNQETITPYNYLFTQLSVILKYIQLLLLPLRQNLDYDFPISNTFWSAKVLLSLAALSGILWVGLRQFNRHRVLSFGILWFFLTLSVESSIVPLNDIIFEHRTYLPAFGFLFMLSYAVLVLPGVDYAPAARPVLIGMVALFSLLAFQRNKVWKDEIALWSDVIAKSPNKARAYNNRAKAYSVARQFNLALPDYARAVEIFPLYTDAYKNRGLLFAEIGDWNKALADADKTVELSPDDPVAYLTRGLVYYNLRQLDKAVPDYERCIALDPKQASAYFSRGVIYAIQGQWEKAIADYDQTIALNPQEQETYRLREEARQALAKAKTTQ